MRGISILLFLWLFFCNFTTAQEKTLKPIPDSLRVNRLFFNYEVHDSLSKFSFKELEDKYYNCYKIDTSKAYLYSRAYNVRSLEMKDSIKIARSYLLFSRLTSYEHAIILSDSIIHYSKNSKHKSYPAAGYIKKGHYNYMLGNYTEALDNYLIANKYAIERNNIDHQLRIKQAIGSLKYLWGSNEEAEIIFKEQLGLLRSVPNYKTKKRSTYKTALFNLSASYIFNKKNDSALNIIKEGIKESLSDRDSVRYYEFVLNSALALYYKDAINPARDSILKVLEFEKEVNTASCHMYLGLISQKKNKDNDFVKHFETVDSLLVKSNDILPEYQDIYNTLIQYYRKKGDVNKELKYIKRLLELDSIIDRNNHYLKLQIVKKYDTPNLLAQKELIISNLDKKNTKSKATNYVLVFLLTLAVCLGVYFYWQKYVYKKRFIKIMENKEKNTVSEKNQSKNKSEYRIPNEKIEEIFIVLKKFEEEKAFLKKNITAVDLAKKFGTNSKYLTQVITIKRNKPFKQYINDLRINYTINELKKNNSIWRNYTIKAIAKESGFNNAESFSNAFNKLSGLTPSYFLKKLNNP